MNRQKKKQNKTVLIITSHYPPNIGGVESHLQALVSGLVEKDWQVIISTYQPLAYSKKAPSVEKKQRILIYRQSWLGFNIVHKLTPYPILEFLYLFPGLFLGTLGVLLNQHLEIDVIHCQGLVPTTIGVILGKLFSKRIISSTHNLYFFSKNGLYPWIAKQIFSGADKVLVPTEIAKSELVEIGVSESKIGFFSYWIDLKLFQPVSRLRAKKQLSWEGFTVLFVGRLIPTKGVNLILEIIRALKPKITVIIAGSGAMEDKVRQTAQKYSPKLKFLGRIENNQLPLYYSAADIALVPSTVDEGWGFVAMEAISCGTPVIASNKGGLSDVVSPQVGKLIPPTKTELEKIINNLFTHQIELVKLQAACRKYANSNFGKSNIYKIIKYYDNSD